MPLYLFIFSVLSFRLFYLFITFCMSLREWNQLDNFHVWKLTIEFVVEVLFLLCDLD
jgi:hypothetical protein